jgi:tRNA uridine 5-carboxymethylaminomethyl modification enzyme
MRAGYAIEYDYLPGTQVYPSLESKPIRSLFLAGQIIGTTGYEEAGVLGIMAGINAAQRARGRDPVVLRRDQAYMGVLIDDLVTKEMDEPYRMHTSQAEFRLLLRQDNAEERLSGIGHDLGLIDNERFAEMERRNREISDVLALLDSTYLKPDARTNAALEAAGAQALTEGLRARELLMRVGGSLSLLQDLGFVPADLVDEVSREIETRVRYAGYVSRQEQEVERLRKLEGREIPAGINYLDMHGMRSESRERLDRVRPRTVGQAARVAGVAPSDVSVLLVHLEREGRQARVG